MNYYLFKSLPLFPKRSDWPGNYVAKMSIGYFTEFQKKLNSYRGLGGAEC